LDICFELGKEGKFVLKEIKEGFNGWQDGIILNQERKDEKISRILSILVPFFSWFKTNFLSNPKVQNNPSFLK